MPDLDKAFADLAEPKDLSASFDKNLRELLGQVSEAAVTKYAVSLLSGADPALHPTALRYLGGEQANLVLKKKEHARWAAVWGARVLRYVWSPKQADAATEIVLKRLDDPHWRVAEMCTKVVRAHELAVGADPVAELVTHRLARVRAQALRALGVVGEVRHLPVIHSGLEDEEKDVRREAKKALQLRASKLKLDENDLIAGRFPVKK